MIINYSEWFITYRHGSFQLENSITNQSILIGTVDLSKEPVYEDPMKTIKEFAKKKIREHYAHNVLNSIASNDSRIPVQDNLDLIEFIAKERNLI